MRSSDDFTRAEICASKLLRRYGVADPKQLVLEDLAMAVGVFVRDAPLVGAEARLVRSDGKGLIRVRENLPEEGRRRFAIGHELGHWLLHEAMSQLNVCLTADVVSYRGSWEELEANAFSASLLLPTRYLRSHYAEAPRLSTAQAIAEDLATSLTAAVVRLVETTKDSCLVVFTDIEAGNVLWWRRSRSCPEVWIERQHPIDEKSVTGELVKRGLSYAEAEEVDSSAWFGHVRDQENLLVIEESIRLGSYPTAVTLLSVDYR
jgi:Zn-dependent peptidase ImmA (M78 family)